MKGKYRQYQKTNITEVYETNFIAEIKRLSSYLDEYHYIGMDTEFPGMVYPCPSYTQDFYYRFIKTNVDKLKLIQLGITLLNDKGETAPEGSTWQFNLSFNVDEDVHSNDSILMLSNSGIDFDVMKTKGIPHHFFAEYFVVSGLLLNDEVKWICFNGFTDFAYLLRLVLNANLPENEDEFLLLLDTYFPEYYDIKILTTVNDNLKGGLNKLAQQLHVERHGEMHQAGSDSIVTADVFFQMIFRGLISKEELTNRRNVLFGIGKGADDNETYQYTIFNVQNGHVGIGIGNLNMKTNNNIVMNGMGFGNYYNGNSSGLNNSYEHIGNKNYSPYGMMTYGNN